MGGKVTDHHVVLPHDHVGVFDGGWLGLGKGVLDVVLWVSHGAAKLPHDGVVELAGEVLGCRAALKVLQLREFGHVDAGVEELLFGWLKVLGEVLFEPLVFSDARDRDPLDRIDNQHLADEILGVDGEVGRHRVFALCVQRVSKKAADGGRETDERSS